MNKGMAFVCINEATKYTYLFGFVENYDFSGRWSFWKPGFK